MKDGWKERRVFQPFHSQTFKQHRIPSQRSTISVTWQWLKQDLAGVASSAVVPDILPGRGRLYRASARKSPATHAHPDWNSSWYFCGMQSLQEPGAGC